MKYLSFDVGIKNLAFCSLNSDKKILDWGIINLNKDPKCQCGLQKECSKTATYQVTDNNETKYACTTHVKKFTKKKKLLILFLIILIILLIYQISFLSSK